MLITANVSRGRRVLEAGVGSGALSIALVRSGASVVGYEIREDFAGPAKAHVADACGDDADYDVVIKDVTLGIDERDLDCILLDLPEPWKVVEHASMALKDGGILVAYLPTINQSATLRSALDKGPYCLAETFETLRRTWHIEARSVRPDHRMVAHTGFITSARKTAGAKKN
jgi:tRNA (adenine57-N1/adenine58-N1)-methyltransferase